MCCHECNGLGDGRFVRRCYERVSQAHRYSKSAGRLPISAFTERMLLCSTAAHQHGSAKCTSVSTPPFFLSYFYSFLFFVSTCVSSQTRPSKVKSTILVHVSEILTNPIPSRREDLELLFVSARNTFQSTWLVLFPKY